MKRPLIFLVLPLLHLIIPSLALSQQGKGTLSFKEKREISHFLRTSIKPGAPAITATVKFENKNNRGTAYTIRFPGKKNGLKAFVTETEDIIIRDLQGFRRDTLRKQKAPNSHYKSALLELEKRGTNKFFFKLESVKRKFSGNPLSMDCPWGHQSLWSYKSTGPTSGILTFRAPFSPIQAFELFLLTHRPHLKEKALD